MSVTITKVREGMFDLNYTNNRLVVPTLGAETCLVSAEPLTTWSTAVLTIYRSMDGVTPYALETAQTISAAAMSTTIDSSSFPYLIVQLTTNAGSAIYATITVTRSKSSL
jgi:hypothetical protein